MTVSTRSKAAPLRVLVVEDQPDIARNIAEYFEPKGYLVDFAINGHQALDLVFEQTFDVVLLDIMLPGISGLEVCAEIRQRADRHIPILMLTARDTTEDKIAGLSTGADDYLTKPFSLRELELRCLSLAKRHQSDPVAIIEVGELSINRRQRQVSRAGQLIELNQMPYRILLFLAEQHPKVVSRSALCHHLWGEDYNDSDSLRSHLYQLRRAIDKPFDFPMIKTIHGVGFALVEHQ